MNDMERQQFAIEGWDIFKLSSHDTTLSNISFDCIYTQCVPNNMFVNDFLGLFPVYLVLSGITKC